MARAIWQAMKGQTVPAQRQNIPQQQGCTGKHDGVFQQAALGELRAGVKNRTVQKGVAAQDAQADGEKGRADAGKELGNTLSNQSDYQADEKTRGIFGDELFHGYRIPFFWPENRSGIPWLYFPGLGYKRSLL